MNAVTNYMMGSALNNVNRMVIGKLVRNMHGYIGE